MLDPKATSMSILINKDDWNLCGVMAREPLERMIKNNPCFVVGGIARERGYRLWVINKLGRSIFVECRKDTKTSDGS